MHGWCTRKRSTKGMTRRLAVASAIGIAITAALLPGSGLGSSVGMLRGAQEIPAGLAGAIRAGFGAGAIRSSRAMRSTDEHGLGYSVALSADGTTALVGAYDDRYNNADAAQAYVFHVADAGSWSSSEAPTATLTYKQGTAAGQFTYDVALSADGTTAFVGADTGSSRGAIYVFHVAAEDAWKSSSKPTATLKASQLFSWGSIALSRDGTTLVAGAPLIGQDRGGAYVFHASNEGAWASTSSPTATLKYAGESIDDGLVGWAVAISADGTTALLSDDQNASGGAALLYHASAENAWTSTSTPTAILSDADGASDDRLGLSVALSGDGTVAFLGAPGSPDNASTAGAVDVFHASGEAAWASTSTPTATLTKAGATAGSLLGWGVAVSADGTTALVTAPGLDAGRDAAYVFRVSNEDAWASSSAPAATLTASGGFRDKWLGYLEAPGLSDDGATALIGAPGARSKKGAADVFHVSDASSWTSSSTPTAMLTVAPCVVPRIIGLTVSVAKSQLKARFCGLGRVRRVHATARKGRVVSQSRRAGVHLPHGAKVDAKIAK